MRVENSRYAIGCQEADYSKRQVICKNATTLGRHTVKARVGCWLIWEVTLTNWGGKPVKKQKLGRMFARVEGWRRADSGEVRIAVLALDDMAEFGMLRWVYPDDVICISESPPAAFLEWVTGSKFLDAAKDPSIMLHLIDYGSMCDDFIHNTEVRIEELKARRKQEAERGKRS